MLAGDKAMRLVSSRVWMLAVVVVVLALTAAASAQALDELVIALPTEPTSLDVHRLFTNDDWNLAYHIFDPLMYRTPDGEFVPGLLEKWTPVDAEGRVWDLQLRRGVTFHNGEPWTAEVLVYNFDRIHSFPEATVRGYLAGIDTYEVVDDYTVRVTLKIPWSLVEQSLYMVGMVPKEYTESVGPDGFARHPVGTGPFEFVEMSRGEYVRLKRYDGYWGPKPAFAKGVIRFIPEPAVRVAGLVAGELHVIKGVSVYDVESIENSNVARVISRPGPRMYHLKLDTFRPEGGPAGSPGLAPGTRNPFQDRRVRQAIWHAINIDELIEYGLQGFAAPATQLVAPFIRGYNPAVEKVPYDPARARQLLAEAGFPNGFSVRLDVLAGWQVVGELITAYLADVGIDATLNVMPPSVYNTMGPRFETSFVMGSWGSTMVNTAFDALIHSVEPERGLGRANWGRYSNPSLDELIDQARESFDPEVQEALYQELQAAAMKEVAVIPLFHEGILVGVHNSLDAVPWYNEHVMMQNVTPRSN